MKNLLASGLRWYTAIHPANRRWVFLLTGGIILNIVLFDPLGIGLFAFALAWVLKEVWPEKEVYFEEGWFGVKFRIDDVPFQPTYIDKFNTYVQAHHNAKTIEDKLLHIRSCIDLMIECEQEYREVKQKGVTSDPS